MKLRFSKYHGTGNDFILIDGVNQTLDVDQLNVPSLCDRHFGIGADGLIVIQNHDELDFHMIYFNSDGSQSFCGNGSRCAVSFAQTLGLVPGDGKTIFLSTDGIHKAEILHSGEIKLSMTDVQAIEELNEDYILHTGSPHYIRQTGDLENLKIIPEAHSIRYSERFSAKGINVNFVEFRTSDLSMRTYERGVENETLSCGTGVTASAIAWHKHHRKSSGQYSIPVHAPGGDLTVHFSFDSESGYTNVILQGPATFVFDGSVDH